MEKVRFLDKFRLALSAGDHKAFAIIAWTAPLYFVLFSLARSYAETNALAVYPLFSYYRGLHHILWNITSALALIMTLQAYTGTETRKLMFMLFGVTFMVVPLLHSLITGAPLELTYLQGGLKSILRDIATFCLFNPKNRPLSYEMMMLVGGIGMLAWIITGSKVRGWGAFVSSYLAGILVAIHWVGLPSMSEAVFKINTELSIHIFQAVVYSYGAMGMVLYASWRQGLFRNERLAWKRSFGWGGTIWLLHFGAAMGAGWFGTPFDCMAAGLPLFTASAMVIRMNQEGWQSRNSKAALCLLSVLLVFQLLVLGPIYLGIQGNLTGPGAVRWIVFPIGG